MYYYYRNLLEPNVEASLLWAHDELGEAWNVVSQKEPWVRNNPESKTPWSKEAFGTELGDAMMMTFVAGYLEDVDPFLCMLQKIATKMSSAGVEGTYLGLLSDVAGACEKEIKRVTKGGKQIE